MKLLAALIATFILASCAFTSSYQAATPVDAYKKYQAEATRDNIAATADQYFAESVLKEKDLADPSIHSQLLFKNYMAKDRQQLYQTFKEGRACLTVNGYDEEQLPIAFYLAFLKAGDSWLITEIEVNFLESASDFESHGRCPA